MGMDSVLHVGSVVIEVRGGDIGLGDAVDGLKSNKELIMIFLD